jgi:hypothetical protein
MYTVACLVDSTASERTPCNRTPASQIAIAISLMVSRDTFEQDMPYSAMHHGTINSCKEIEFFLSKKMRKAPMFIFIDFVPGIGFTRKTEMSDPVPSDAMI